MLVIPTPLTSFLRRRESSDSHPMCGHSGDPKRRSRKERIMVLTSLEKEDIVFFAWRLATVRPRPYIAGNRDDTRERRKERLA